MVSLTKRNLLIEDRIQRKNNKPLSCILCERTGDVIEEQ